MTDRLILVTTALAVLMVASVAAIISFQHAYELVTTHGETGVTARRGSRAWGRSRSPPGQ